MYRKRNVYLVNLFFRVTNKLKTPLKLSHKNLIKIKFKITKTHTMYAHLLIHVVLQTTKKLKSQS